MFDGLFQPQHLLIILVVALFIFGPKKLPELGQGLGKGIRSFRDSMRAGAEEPQKPEPVAQKSRRIYHEVVFRFSGPGQIAGFRLGEALCGN